MFESAGSINTSPVKVSIHKCMGTTSLLWIADKGDQSSLLGELFQLQVCQDVTSLEDRLNYIHLNIVGGHVNLNVVMDL